MTDNYELEEHGDDQEHGQEHEAADENEPKAGTWQDDQPPVDDLMEDHTAASEDTVEPVHEQEESTETKKRKSSVLLPIMVVVIGLALLGGILYWQFMRAPSSQPAKDFAAHNTINTAKTPVGSGAVSAEADVAPKTSLLTASGTSTSGFPSPSSAQTGTAMPTNAPSAPSAGLVTPSANTVTPPSAQPTHIVTASGTPPSPMSAPTSPVEPAATTSSALTGSQNTVSPVSSSAKTSEVVPAAHETVQTSIPTSPSAMSSSVSSAIPSPHITGNMAEPSSSNADVDARIAALSGRIEDLKKTLDQVTQQLAQSSTTGNPSGGNTQIDKRLTQIEQQLAQLEKHSGIAEEPVLPATEGAPVRSKSTHKTSRHHKGRVHKVKTGTSKTTAQHTEQPAEAVHPASTGWVLRAATPTEAWVAKDATTPELHHVQIGDELAGVGRIKAIRQEGNSWIIEGDHGAIH